MRQFGAGAGKFGLSLADRLRRRRPRLGDKWHVDEVFIWLQRVQHYLWRAVDQDGVVLDTLVQERRDAKAAKRSSGACRKVTCHGSSRPTSCQVTA